MSEQEDTQDELVKLKRSRTGYIASLSRASKEIQRCMDDGNADEVDRKREKKSATFQRLTECHNEYLSKLDDEDEQDRKDAIALYERELHNMADIESRIKSWHRVVSQVSDVHPGDSVSQIGSRVSQRSKSSSVFSMKVKAQTSKALAELKMKQVEKEFELSRQEDELKRKMALMKSQHEIDQAIMELDVITKAEIEDVEGSGQNTTIQSQIGIPLTKGAKQIEPNTDAPEWNISQKHKANVFQHEDTNSHHPSRGDVQELMPELITFSGDPLVYWQFIRSFEKHIERKVTDKGERLNYLLQYCTGEAKQVIKNCVVMDDDTGYKKARDLLFERFGEPYVIATAQIKQVTGGAYLKQSDRLGLLALSDKLRDCEITLSSVGYLDEINSADNLRRVAERFPYNLKPKWLEVTQALRRAGKRPNISEMVKFITAKAKAVNDPVFGQILDDRDQSKSSKATFNKNRPRSAMATSLATWDNPVTLKPEEHATSVGATEFSYSCPACSKKHYLIDCEVFKAKAYEDKRQLLRLKGICDNCLRRGHIAKNCRFRTTCQVENCNRRHHSIMHPPTSNISSEATELKTAVAGNGQSFAVNTDPSTSRRTSKICLPIVPVKIRNSEQGQVIETYALLDSGSDVTLCSEMLADQLNLKGSKKNYTLTTLGKENNAMCGMRVNLHVSPIDDSDTIKIPMAWTIEKLPISEESIPTCADTREWSHLEDLELPKCDIHDAWKRVNLLIGNDVPEAFWVIEEKRGKRKEPYAVKSLLGWTLLGPAANVNTRSNFYGNFVSKDDLLQSTVEKFWNTDFGDPILASKPAMSKEDVKALKIIETSIMIDNGHYNIALPWREGEDRCVLNNRQQAERRLQLLKRRFDKDPNLFEKYKGHVTDYIVKGYARVVDDNEEKRSNTDNTIWYLPHHPVMHAKKPGKVRVVFDCSARFQGKSLNDMLLQGPDLNNNLIGVLMRFRQDFVALVADVEAMFHQVKVAEKDTDAFRFLWWPDNDISKEPVDHKMLVHVFGATSSPCVAIFALRRTADDAKGYFEPEVIETVHKNFYVDDLLKSVPEVDEAIQMSKQLREMLLRGGFSLTKWICNRKEVLDAIPCEHKAKAVKDLDLNGVSAERTLGVCWNVQKDEFFIQTDVKDKLTTRRTILSTMSSVYDPLGFAAPFVFNAKMLLQDLCRMKLSWDEDVPEQYNTKWRKWLLDLPQLNISINRCYKIPGFEKPLSYELHTFCDASQSGYAAVCYLRMTNSIGEVHCSFVIGKSRLAPIKSITIPRLELSAAVLGVKLNEMVKEELEIPISRSTFWTDSSAVLQFIRNENRRFHMFVANRLSVIHSHTTKSQWKYVNTEVNPADDVTRGLTITQMLHNQRWLNSPSFLLKLESSWPATLEGIPDIPDDNPEVKTQSFMVKRFDETHAAMTKLMEHYSTWYKLKKGIGWLRRFLSYLKLKINNKDDSTQMCCSGPLSIRELQDAENTVIKVVQKEVFHDELSSLLVKGQVKKSSCLYKLNPVLRSDGLIVIGGRLRNAQIEEYVKHPPILPKQHHITEMIVRSYHEMYLHVGREHLLSLIRERYWIINARSIIRRVLRKCFECRRRFAVPETQLMADLPQDRLIPDKPPFSYTGVDFFGPIPVKQGRATVKRYGCIFTCLTSRAIHIEICHSLETDSFINALLRFMSRRGNPIEFRSDNGTNFKGAEKELKDSITRWNQHKISETLKQHEISWIFNPPSASHMGGVWERLIRSIRAILRVLLKQQSVNDETLSTFMTQVEGLLNSRPIVTPSDDSKDMEPLTPNHLLLSRSSTALPPGIFTKDDLYCRRRWRQVQYLTNRFWQRWLKEYLPTLQVRQKWNKPKRNLSVGDVALLMDENMPRGSWPLCRVVKVYASKDGYVRSVCVKTKTGCYDRPISKLCLLEACN